MDGRLCYALLLPAASRPSGGVPCLPANRLLLLLPPCRLLLSAPLSATRSTATLLLLLPSACSACCLLLLLLLFVQLPTSCCQLFAPPALCWCELGSRHQLQQQYRDTQWHSTIS
jgi:hypothetical protein